MPDRRSGPLQLEDVFRELLRSLDELQEKVDRSNDAILLLQAQVIALTARVTELESPSEPFFDPTP